MFVKVDSSTPKTNNKGSSGQFIEYLSKENEDKEYSEQEHFLSPRLSGVSIVGSNSGTIER